MCPPKAETLFLFIANLELLVLHYKKHKYPPLRREYACLPTRIQLRNKLKQLKLKKLQSRERLSEWVRCQTRFSVASGKKSIQPKISAYIYIYIYNYIYIYMCVFYIFIY